MPLRVQLHSETNIDEVCEVLDELQKYIPTKDCITTYDVLVEGKHQCIEVNDSKQYQILTGGDQFSVARYRSARTNHDLTVERLEGFVPVIEDWHARLTLVKVKGSL